MAMPNAKNFALTGAATDLGVGLGFTLQEQLKNDLDERKKKNQKDMQYPSQFGDSVLNSAAMDLGVR